MDHFQLKYIEEATELISDLEQALLKLESDANDKETIDRVFRVMHTLKGNSSMFGFDKIGEFTHHLETIYDNVRQGKMKLSKEVFNVTLNAVDHIKELLHDINLSDPQNKKNHENLLAKVIEFANHTVSESIVAASDIDDLYGFFEDSPTYHIYFKPNQDIFNNGTNPLYLIDELCTLGQCSAFPNTNSIPPFAELIPTNCYVAWDIILTTFKDENAIADVFIFVEDECDLQITKLSTTNLLNEIDFTTRLQSLYNKEKNINILDINSLVHDIENQKADNETKPESIKQPAQNDIVLLKKEGKDNNISSIRVSSDKIDEMMNLVSELVTSQARLSMLSENIQVPELSAIAENMQKLSRQLRDTAFNISLIQIQNIITRFQRLVRDLSQELHKDVDFITEGAETELDKTIIENITDPLMHILRNSMDHGIEDAETRIKNGKPAKGKIILSAFYSGVFVYLEIKDDGAGINPEKIRNKAISKGLIAPDANLSKKELLDLVFLPGFSTATVVTDVSGRGVGMDVVRRKISDIRGEVEIDSEINKGTTITIKLPLTLSIIDGLLVQIQDTNFILQLNAVNKIYAITHTEIENAHRNILVLDGESIPFYYLRNEFGLEGEIEEIEQVIIVRYLENKVGLVIDKVIGEYQAVIKPLGKHYKKQEMISGASILGDGTIALVIDTNKIIKQCSQEK